MIEHELALAVALQVRRGNADQDAALPERDMTRQPPAVGRDATRTLERIQKRPLEKRRRLFGDQRIPLVFADFSYRLVCRELDGRQANEPLINGLSSANQ